MISSLHSHQNYAVAALNLKILPKFQKQGQVNFVTGERAKDIFKHLMEFQSPFYDLTQNVGLPGIAKICSALPPNLISDLK